MTKEEARERSADARVEHVRLKREQRHAQEMEALRELERKRIAALVGPGTDAGHDDTGFSDGVL